MIQNEQVRAYINSLIPGHIIPISGNQNAIVLAVYPYHAIVRYQAKITGYNDEPRIVTREQSFTMSDLYRASLRGRLLNQA